MPINLDANASFDLLPEVQDGLQQLLDRRDLRGLNPSSIHTAGQRASSLIERSRDSIARLVGLPKGGRVIFTSGATEANNLALNLPFADSVHCASTVAGLVTTKVEHPSVLEPSQALIKRGVRVSVVTVRDLPEGEILTASEVADLVDSSTRLVSIMAANNETGHLLPLRAVRDALIAKNPNTLMHSDAVQIIGRVPFSMEALNLDLVSVSGHKLGALSGVGALLVGSRVAHGAMILGGPQERRWRAGTENVLGIMSLGVAADLAYTQLELRSVVMRERAAQLCSALLNIIPDARLISNLDHGLPNTLSITIPGVLADDLVIALDLAGILCSSGAACASGKPEPSHVLLALGLSERDARSTLRFSLQGTESPADIEFAAQSISNAVLHMRRSSTRGASCAA